MSQDGAVINKGSLKDWINTNLIINRLGITDAMEEELELLAANIDDATTIFAAILSLRAHIGWSTHGHSAVDVNIYSSGGPEVECLHGNRENTDVGKFLQEYLDVDVEGITAELREKMKGVLSPSTLMASDSDGSPVSDYGLEGLNPEWAGVLEYGQ